MPENSAVAVSEMWTVGETAAKLRISTSGVRAMIIRGDLPAVRVGSKLYRINPADVARLIQPACVDDDSTGPGAE